MKKRYLLFLLLVINTLFLKAQKDTVFWFAAPEATTAHGDRPIVVRMSTTGNPANVTITQPASPSFAPINVAIGPNSSQTIDLTTWIDSLENKPSNTVLNYGLKISSDQPISAYYEVVTSCNCNPEIYALKGKNSLGTAFMIPFQQIFDNGIYNPQANSAFIIVATENNTQVTITPSADVVGHPAGIPYTITLQKGQTYTAAQPAESATGNLAGSIVTSNKKIAITIKDDSLSFQGCRDLAGDQIVPLTVIGKEYIVVKGSLNVTDKVYILSTQNNTNIQIDGTSVGTFASGQTFALDLTNPSTYIQSSQPVYVLHYTGFGCEIGSALVPPIICTGSDYVSVTRSTSEYFGLILMTRAGNEGSFTLNGNPALIPAAAFSPVPGTGGNYVQTLLSFSTVDVPTNTPSVVFNSSGLFHMGIINGGAGSGCRYGYFSDFSGVGFTSSITSFITCNGASDGAVDLTPIGGLPPFQYLWNTGDTTQDLSGLSAGTYEVYITDIAGCVDSAQVNVPEPAVLTLQTSNLDNVTCFNGSNGSISVLPQGGTIPYQILWNTGSTSQTISNLLPGNYSVTFTDANNCDTLNLSFTITEPPKMPLSVSMPDSVVCLGADSITINASGAVSYLWQPSTGLTDSTANPVIASPSETTVYTLYGTDAAGCVDSMKVKVITTDFSGNITAVNAVPGCFGKVFFNADAQKPEDVSQWFWNFGDSATADVNPTEHIYAGPGPYPVLFTATDKNQCDTTVTLEASPANSPTIDKLVIPNILTTNGDGLNEKLVIDPAYAECGNYTIKIFNRWGNLVFESLNNTPEFYGQTKLGAKLGPGTYFWILSGQGFENKGTLEIVH